jgi:hypothetical protein
MTNKINKERRRSMNATPRFKPGLSGTKIALNINILKLYTLAYKTLVSLLARTKI